MSRQILNGWKEISGHIKRVVRTAQRWETRMGMPVHRRPLNNKSAVVAFSDELDRWISRTSPDPDPLLQMREKMSSLAWHTAELASQTRTLQEQLRQSIEAHKNRVASRIRPRTLAPASRPIGVMLPFRSGIRTRSGATKVTYPR
jgi:hypothetical protein